jgi:hypothetical protein
MKNLIRIIALSLIFHLVTFVHPLSAQSQTAKHINHQEQLWLSLNNTIKLSPKWGIIADLHMRRNNFAADPNFYFVRGGINYWFNKELSAAAGYGHMWVATPTGEDNYLWLNENRIYEQFQYSGKINKTGLLLRVRNEQRWQQKPQNGEKSDNYRFTNRIRYLTSLSIPIFKNPKLPRLMVADEIAVQFGKEVVYNTFDQNRLTIGIQQKITRDLSFDLGYMLVTQQRLNGYLYDMNNTLRLFFYYTPNLSQDKKDNHHRHHLSGEE